MLLFSFGTNCKLTSSVYCINLIRGPTSLQGARQKDASHYAGWRERPHEGTGGLGQRGPAEADPGEDLPRGAESDGPAGKRDNATELHLICPSTLVGSVASLATDRQFVPSTCSTGLSWFGIVVFDTTRALGNLVEQAEQLDKLVELPNRGQHNTGDPVDGTFLSLLWLAPLDKNWILRLFWPHVFYLVTKRAYGLVTNIWYCDY